MNRFSFDYQSTDLFHRLIDEDEQRSVVIFEKQQFLEIELIKQNIISETYCTLANAGRNIQQQSSEIMIYNSLAPLNQPNSDEQEPLTQRFLFSQETIKSSYEAEKGEGSQTKNICTNLQTLTLKFLRQLGTLTKISQSENEKARLFKKSRPSIQDFKKLFESVSLGEAFKKYYESKHFIQSIMTSQINMRTKLILIKYLQKIRRLTFDRSSNSWKKMAKAI